MTREQTMPYRRSGAWVSVVRGPGVRVAPVRPSGRSLVAGGALGAFPGWTADTGAPAASGAHLVTEHPSPAHQGSGAVDGLRRGPDASGRRRPAAQLLRSPSSVRRRLQIRCSL